MKAFAPVLLLSLVALAASSGGCEEERAGVPCQELAKGLCQKARMCAKGTNACGWVDEGGTLGRNCSVCEIGVVDRLCKDPTKTTAQIETCEAAIEQTTCVTPEEPSKAKLPAACRDVLLCGGGPCQD